jgi:cobalt-zinc-cadmium efflux system membrane fusion protein
MRRIESPVGAGRKRLLAAIVSLALGLACGKKASKEIPDPKPSQGPPRIQLTAASVASAGIQVEAVASKVLDEFLSVSGTLSFDENKVARVGPRIGGRVVRILADFGKEMRSGQALAEIDSPELGEALAQWRKSRSVYSVRQQDVERARKLLEGKAISQGEFLSREGEFRVAKAELDNADSRLHLLGLSHADFAKLTAAGEVRSQFPLTSPIAGKVIDRKVNPGEVVEAGKPLFTVGDIRTLWLLVQLYEKDLPRVRAGQEVEVLTEAFPKETFRGRIDYVGDQVEPATRTVRARSVIGNPRERLKPGMFVEARLSVTGGSPVIAVPTAAIQEVDKVPTVFVETAPNVFEPRPIELGRTGSKETEVKKGLRPGERVVTQGSLLLKAEMKKSELAGD